VRQFLRRVVSPVTKLTLADPHSPRTLAWGLLVLLLVFPLVDGNPYHLRVATSVALYVTLVLGLNVVVGQAGLLDLGYIGFYAIGAYTCALLASPHLGMHLSFWSIVPLAAALTALAGVMLGFPVLRLRGDYLAVVTLGFGEIIRILLMNLDRPFNLTNGPNGIIRIDSPRIAGRAVEGPWQWYYLMVALAVVVYTIYCRLDASRAGLAWKALRDDELGAMACGIDPVKYKLAAFAAGAAIAGAAGVFFASWQGAVFPQTFSMAEVVTIFCMAVLGGVGSPLGAVVGAATLVVLPELLRVYASYRMVIYGLLLVALMQVRPHGLIPARPHRLTRARPHNLTPVRPHRVTAGAAHGVAGGQLHGPGPAGGRRSLPPRPGQAPAHGPDAGAGEGDVVLAVEGVSKRFGGVVALDGVSLRLRRGEVLAVIGPNGAGKSTLVDVIAGYLAPDAGRVWVAPEGRLEPVPLDGLPPHRRAALGVMRSFQNPRLFLSLTPAANLAAGEFALRARGRLRPRGWSGGAGLREDPRAPAGNGLGVPPDGGGPTLLPSLRLEGDGSAPQASAAVLTYADRRKLEVLRALAGGPRVLLLDEPAAGMTEQEVEELCTAVRTIAEAGVAVLLIEHRMEVVRRVAHRVLAMAEGRVLAEGSPAYVLSHPEVVRSYLGQEGATSAGSGLPRVAPVERGGRGGEGERPPVLEVSGLVAGYGSRPVLQGVDLQVREGELVCLLGANAAGKSTLLRAIFGSARVFSGDIRLDGRRVVGWPPEDVVRAGAALVPEGRRIFGRLTVRENLELGAGCLARSRVVPGGGEGRSARVPAEGTEEALETVLQLFPRLRERLHQPAGSLSGGEQQMLALARALVGRPRLLCLDEPTMGLSPALAAAVLEHVREINALGTAVLLVEQAARLVASWGATCYVLKEGRVAYRGKLDTPDLLAEVEHIYLH